MGQPHTIILNHPELHTAFARIEELGDPVITRIVAIGGGNLRNGVIRSNLELDVKAGVYKGKTYLISNNLRGIRDLVVPEIWVRPADKKLMACFAIGGKSFTQTSDDDAYSYFKQTRGFSRHFAEVMSKRVAITVQRHNGLPILQHEAMQLEHVEALLTHDEVVKKLATRKETWKVVKEVVFEDNPSVSEIKNDGLLVKHTISYFNGGSLKEEIEYYVIEATGMFRTYRGSNPNFALHDRVGYVYLTKSPTK